MFQIGAVLFIKSKWNACTSMIESTLRVESLQLLPENHQYFTHSKSFQSIQKNEN